MKLMSEYLISNYIVIDIETTGFSCKKNSIIEISAIKVRDNTIVNSFSYLTKPREIVSPYISKLTGITNEMAANGYDIKEVLLQFVKFIDTDILIGHNIMFDLSFINQNLTNQNMQLITNSHLDTLEIAKRCLFLESYKLEVIARYFNISTEGHHRSLNDCIITHEIYQKCKYELVKYEI